MSSKPNLGLPWWDHRKKEKEDNSRRVGLVPWSKENKSTWLQIICPIYHSTTTQNHHVVHSKCSHSSTKIWQTAVVNVGIYYESFYLVLSHFDSDSNTTSYQLLQVKKETPEGKTLQMLSPQKKKKKKKKHYCEELWSPAKYPEKAGAWEHYVNNPIKRCTCTHILNFFNKSFMGF